MKTRAITEDDLIPPHQTCPRARNSRHWGQSYTKSMEIFATLPVTVMYVAWHKNHVKKNILQ